MLGLNKRGPYTGAPLVLLPHMTTFIKNYLLTVVYRYCRQAVYLIFVNVGKQVFPDRS